MLRKLASSLEAPCLAKVAASWRALPPEGEVGANIVDARAESARTCFLAHLEEAVEALSIELAPRDYRDAFTVNYRKLLPGVAPNYRVSILAASARSARGAVALYVNADKYEFSTEAVRKAERLQSVLRQLGELLDRWQESWSPLCRTPRPGRAEVKSLLSVLDASWAAFEHRYISDLIEIEGKARRLVVEAIEQEQALQRLDAKWGRCHEHPEYVEARRRLVACIARINAVANTKRRGRDDLGAEILECAYATCRRCRASSQDAGIESRALCAAKVLASDVIDSFNAVRRYLRDAERHLERIDPHLRNNVGLVSRLVDWEQTWELGARYVQQPSLFDGVVGLVAEMLSAEQLAPELVRKCRDCDAEVFLALPRLLLLHFLAAPAERAELPRSLLPHRFAAGPAEPDAELQEFAERFARVWQSGVAGRTEASKQRAWHVLLARAVVGAGAANPEEQSLVEGEGLWPEVEQLMRELEGWSMELQRHCPVDWSQCSSVLVRCLIGGHELASAAPELEGL